MKIRKLNEIKVNVESKSKKLNESLADKWADPTTFRGEIESDWDQFLILHAMLLDMMKKLDL